jgi:hypothetical protein
MNLPQHVMGRSITLNSPSTSRSNLLTALHSISRIKFKFGAAAFLLLALFGAANPLGHGQTPPILPSLSQQNSLTFTVNPDRTVGIGWNTQTSLPIPSNVSSLFPAGYSIHSSSNFSQQANAVVQTTVTQYQLPQQIYSQPPYSLINSISLTASETGLSGSGSLTATTTSLPIQNLNAVYSTSPSKVSANATAQLYFSQSAYNGTPFANQTIFQTLWAKTFENATWRDSIVTMIQNQTMILSVTAFNGTISYVNYPVGTSATVSIKFAAIPSGTSTDFVTTFEKALFSGATPPSGIDSIIRAAINLVTGETASVTYTGSTGTLTARITTNYVSNLDAQLNSIKSQAFQLILSLQPAGTITPQELFLNATTVTVSKITMTSDLDLHAGTSKSSLNGLIITPPTVGSTTNFTIPGLFQTLGSGSPSPSGVNVTLTGGSDNTYQVYVVVPSSAPRPSSSTPTSATWMNIQNASRLQDVEFQLQKLPFSFFAFLTSPVGIAIDAIIAAAVVGTVLVLVLRRRRAKMPAPISPSGPTTTPGMGPSPAPITP